MKRPEFIARQAGKPRGWLGAHIARIMAKETTRENARALDILDLQPIDSLLDIGAGHGATLQAAAKEMGHGFIAGIDYSKVMVRLAKKNNRNRIRSGRTEVKLASSDNIPYQDASFTKALAVHTIYFWSAPADHFNEVFRILAPGGYFVVCFRPAEDPGFAQTFPETVYHIRSKVEVLADLRQSGFELLSAEEEHGARGTLVFALVKRP